jgi:hypothetical protein
MSPWVLILKWGTLILGNLIEQVPEKLDVLSFCFDLGVVWVVSESKVLGSQNPTGD